jgi:transcriptional regulator with XRE-family HTH domain
MADDKVFFKALGLRLAALRKDAVLSQQAVADQLGVAQQTLAHYEVGTGKRGRTPILQKQIERLHQLPKTQQKVVMQMLDGVLAQASL